MSSEEADTVSDRARRALEVAVFAPLGVLAYARDAAPTLLTVLIARGRGEADRRADEVAAKLRHLRNYGDAFIAFRRGSSRPPGAHHPDGPGPRTDAAPIAAAREPTSKLARGETAASERGGSAVSGAGLPIPSYDSLSASQVVERLPGLATDQLATVRAYEQAHRKRRTILGKIDQLIA